MLRQLKNLLMRLNTLCLKEMGKLFFVNVESAHTKRQREIHLDISAVPILNRKHICLLLVDVTHSTGRRDLLLPAAKAALAIGADGVMAEVHQIRLLPCLIAATNGS